MAYRQPELRSSICPVCNRRLRFVTIAGNRFERCSHCQGVWLEFQIFGEMCVAMALDAVPPTLHPHVDATPKRRCPRCDGEMAQVQVDAATHIPRKVALDTCRTHGIWFDGEELELVLVSVGWPH